MSGEDALIARFFAPIAGPGALGLRDDAGLLAPPPGCDLVVSCDALVAGVHFFPEDPPASIARKALGVNLSDLAAKAARPLGFLLALALPPACDEGWLEAFAGGLDAAATEAACPLLGGDTVATPGPLTIAVTVLGAVATGAMLTRGGARPGDAVYVSGTVGDGALGLAVRAAELRPAEAAAWVARLAPGHLGALRDRYLHPRPRLALAAALGHASAGMDVSDGLVGDLAKLLAVSGASGRLDWARVPLSAAAAVALAVDPSLRATVLTGGDDYEILATVPQARQPAFEAAAAAAGVAVTAIGAVGQGTGPLRVLDPEGRPIPLTRTAYSHV